jgi:GTP-binding protein LepA
MEVVQERLEREYGLDLITTAPTVVYRVVRGGEATPVSNPAAVPDVRDAMEEPFARLEIITPAEYVGTLMELAQTRRGEYVDLKFLSEDRATLVYEVPLAEVVTDFFDELKSRSRGYASMEYHVSGYRRSDLVRLDVKINGETAEPLACVVHRDAAYRVGKGLVQRLKALIPRHQFRVPIQAAVGSRVIASESIPALRKDVLAKCYGGDVSRKKKLLAKQAKGKKRMKTIGRVDVPQAAFMAVLDKSGEKNSSADD